MSDPAGYIVAGPEGGRLVENWDADWRLYAMTEVVTDG